MTLSIFQHKFNHYIKCGRVCEGRPAGHRQRRRAGAGAAQQMSASSRPGTPRLAAGAQK